MGPDLIEDMQSSFKLNLIAAQLNTIHNLDIHKLYNNDCVVECRVSLLLGFGSSLLSLCRFGGVLAGSLAFILLYYVCMSFGSRDCIVCTVVI